MPAIATPRTVLTKVATHSTFGRLSLTFVRMFGISFFSAKFASRPSQNNGFHPLPLRGTNEIPNISLKNPIPGACTERSRSRQLQHSLNFVAFFFFFLFFVVFP